MSKPGGPGEAQEGPVDDFFVRVQDEYVALFWLRNRKSVLKPVLIIVATLRLISLLYLV